MTLTDIIVIITNLFQIATPIAVALAFLFFLWAAFQMLTHTGEKISEYRAQMLWGLLALFVILSVAGIIAFVQNTFFTNGAFRSTSSSNSTERAVYDEGSGAYLKILGQCVYGECP